MKIAWVGWILTVFGFSIPAFAAEYREVAMCSAVSDTAAFPRISIQTEPGQTKRAILILVASDGWTQVYSGPVTSTATALVFDEDSHAVNATFLKTSLRATISFAGDEYICDERSFGH